VRTNRLVPGLVVLGNGKLSDRTRVTVHM
jgi:hypothetical protein